MRDCHTLLERAALKRIKICLDYAFYDKIKHEKIAKFESFFSKLNVIDEEIFCGNHVILYPLTVEPSEDRNCLSCCTLAYSKGDGGFWIIGFQR